MKKIILPIIIIFFASSAELDAQTGVNTASPTATLDVVAKNATGTGTNPEGLLIPRVDRQKAQSMTGVASSTLIYVSSIATGTQTGIASNIDTLGYYYYNGTAWTKLSAGAPTNIYTTDGILAGNRTITQEDKTLAFTGTAANAFSIDGPTLSVNASNDRVGIGTIAPQTKLDIKTANKAYGFQHTDGTILLRSYLGAGVSSGGLEAAWFGTSSRHPLAFMVNDAAVAQIDVGGNLGIGTSTPQKKMHVNGGLQVTNELNVGGTATTAGSSGTDGQILTSAGPGAAPAWKTFADATPSSTGTVLIINGKFVVAQEIAVQMSADFTAPASANAVVIGNLNNEIIDNENQFTGTATNNSFKVTNDGIYQVIVSSQLNCDLCSTTNNSKFPAIGIWDNTAARWVARVNDEYTSGGTPANPPLQSYTLITSIPMTTTQTYSFRVVNNNMATKIKQLSGGTTGTGPVTQMSVKRLR